MAKVGQTFTTGNAVVNTLPAGAQLRVSAKGTLEIVSLPAPKLGDYVTDSKGRTGRIVRMTTRNDFSPSNPIAVFDDNVVRNVR